MNRQAHYDKGSDIFSKCRKDNKMKQKKIVLVMAGILAAAAAMTGCAEQNKTATQVDYTQNSQGKSEQTKQKTAEKSQPDKKQVNKSTSGGKENSNQTADKKTKVFASSNNAGDVQNSGNDADNTDDSQNTYVDKNSSENNGSTVWWDAPTIPSCIDTKREDCAAALPFPCRFTAGTRTPDRTC